MSLTDGNTYVVMFRKDRSEDYREWGAYCYFPMARDVALRLKRDEGWHSYVHCTTAAKLDAFRAVHGSRAYWLKTRGAA